MASFPNFAGTGVLIVVYTLLAACQSLPAGVGAQTGVEILVTSNVGSVNVDLRQQENGVSTLPLGAPREADIGRTIAPKDTLWDRLPSELSPPIPLANGVDLWERLRRGIRAQRIAQFSPDTVAAARMEHNLQWYVQNRQYLNRTFGRARLYLFDIVEAVEREGVPPEVALLPAVESAFQTRACSYVACGLWQFIVPTARRFDLKQHMFVDERYHVRAATQAALRYLKELHARFDGDWQLALAAYNCGEGCIERAARTARAAGRAGRFEELALNRETADYVPRLVALTQLVMAPDVYGIVLPEIRNTPYFTGVAITHDIDVDQAAKLAGISMAEFRALNPQHKKPVIVAAANAVVYVPVEREAGLREAVAKSRVALTRWTATRITRRASVEAIAKAYGANAAELRSVNGVASGLLVEAGSTVLVPRHDVTGTKPDIPAQVMEQAHLATTPAFVVRRVAVRKGDTWQRIATRLQVASASLKHWNPKTRLRHGQIALKLPVEIAETRLPLRNG